MEGYGLLLACEEEGQCWELKLKDIFREAGLVTDTLQSQLQFYFGPKIGFIRGLSKNFCATCK